MGTFVKTFVFNQMNVNSYVLWNNKRDCVFIDPGCITEEEQNDIVDFVDSKRLKPLSILLTHGHFDHVAGISFLKNKYGCECWIHSEDNDELSQSNTIAQLYGVKIKSDFKPDHFFNDGIKYLFGNFCVKVFHLPGHTNGSVAFFETHSNYLFSGDTIIKGSLGFSNCGYGELMTHLVRKIYPLPDETIIFCGHGLSTTIGEEKRSNLFFKLLDK